MKNIFSSARQSLDELLDRFIDKAHMFQLATREYTDPRQVHGFFRRLSSDGKRDLGCGFHCPIRGSSVSDEALKSGARMVHCGRTDVLDTEAVLPEVRISPRHGRWQIKADGTQAIPSDTLDDFDGDFQYKQSDPNFL